MFTGIVSRVARVLGIRLVESGSVRLVVDLTGESEGLVVGASVAINGVCLTVVSIEAETAHFDVISATARLTNLHQLRSDDRVNIERSLKMGDELGGHILSGHIASTVEVESYDVDQGESRLTFHVPDSWKKYLQPMGFVALNGVSLTLAKYDTITGCGTVNLIPETLRSTNLVECKAGTQLNLEIDPHTLAIVQTVEEYLRNRVSNSEPV